MTEMRRVTIVIPHSLDERIWELKKEDRFLRCSYAEMVRRLLELGLLMLHAVDQQEGRAEENAEDLPELDGQFPEGIIERSVLCQKMSQLYRT